MTLDERKRVHEIVVDQAAGRLTIVAHVGTTSTAQSVSWRNTPRRSAPTTSQPSPLLSPPRRTHRDRVLPERWWRRLTSRLRLQQPQGIGVDIAPGFPAPSATWASGASRTAASATSSSPTSCWRWRGLPRLPLHRRHRGHRAPGLYGGCQGLCLASPTSSPEIMVELWDAYVAGDYERAAPLQLKVLKARKLMHIPSSTNAACYVRACTPAASMSASRSARSCPSRTAKPPRCSQHSRQSACCRSSYQLPVVS